jgi:hypothetical protein
VYAHPELAGKIRTLKLPEDELELSKYKNPEYYFLKFVEKNTLDVYMTVNRAYSLLLI